MAPRTVVETIAALVDELDARRSAPTQTDPLVGRALSMAITSLEDARIRYTEARARQLGVFSPADLDRGPNGELMDDCDLDARRAAAAKFAARDDRAAGRPEAPIDRFEREQPNIARTLAEACAGGLTPDQAMAELTVRFI